MSPVIKQTMRGKTQAASGRAINAPVISPRARLVFLLIAAAVATLLILAPRGLHAAPSFPNEGYRSARGPAAASLPYQATQTVTWSAFTPTDWVLTLPFTATISADSPVGLDPLADAYAVSTDGGATWSGWSTAGLSTSIPVSTTHRMSVSNLSFGDSAALNYIRFRVAETGASEVVSSPYPVRVDATPPAAPRNLTANPPTWSNTGSFTVNWTNPTDVAGIVGAWYKLDSAPTSPSDGKFVVTSNSITGITPNGDGAHSVYVWLQDSVGRADPKNAVSTTLYWDTTPPDPPTRMTGSPARQWTNVNKFSESWRNPSDPSGIVGAYYKLNGLPLSATDGEFVATTNSIADIQVPYEGRHDIYVWLVDAAGNLDPQALTGDPDVFWYDATPPVSSMVMTPTLPSTGWYTSSVQMTFSAVDLPIDNSRPPVVYYQLDNSAWTAANSVLNFGAEGTHKLQYQGRDKANNVEATKDFSFGIDKTAPTLTLQPDRPANSTGWYTAAVTYTLSVVDTVSGAPRGFYRLNDGPWQSGSTGTATFSLAAEGSYRIQYYGVDAAGNRSAQTTVEARVDGTAPATTMTIDGAAGENGWYASNVTVHLTPSDNGSGAVTTRYRIGAGAWQTGTQFSLSGEGIYDVAYTSTDAAGNVEPTVTTQVKIDKTAPAAPSGLTAAPSGWSRTNAFTVQWTSPNDLSGVAGAYYKLGDLSGGGAPTGPKDGTAVAQTQRIDALALPAEGSYRLYLWLRDAAGNADQKTAPANGPVLRFDATPPTTTAKAQGTAGQNGWWQSPVTVTLTATDGASGVALLHYRLDGGAWQATNKPTATVSVSTPEKHVIEYYAEDVAGNFEATQQYTARLDFTPPPAPALYRVLPAGWTRYNTFHIEWTAVTDQSNIGGAYVRFDKPPANPTDGTFYPGSTEINSVKAPAEGKHSVYAWLRDGAGNADYRTAVAISDPIWYDGTSPTSVITATAASGLNDWYVEPVTFDVSASDGASGLREIHYQIDDDDVQSANIASPATTGAPAPQPLTATTRFVVSANGRHTVRVWAVDQAGNVEAVHVYQVAIDRTPPLAWFTGPGSQVTRTAFDVTWAGADNADSSGLASYDVQVRDGIDAAWQDWLVQTQLTSARFEGERGHQYTFRVFARDRAGNRQAAAGLRKILVQPVLNGGFDTGAFTDWTYGGPLVSSVVATTGPSGVSTLAGELGSEAYGPSLTPPGTVPAGCATITQPVEIPTLQQLKEPRLRFWYRIQSYDKEYSEKLQTFVDTLNVKFVDDQGQEVALLLREGNPTSDYKVLYDSGWRLADVDLRPYSGMKVNLLFANCNGPQNGHPDNMYNTWSYVDGIEIYDPSRVYAPAVSQQSLAGAAASSTESSVEAQGAVPATQPVAEPEDTDPLR